MSKLFERFLKENPHLVDEKVRSPCPIGPEKGCGTCSLSIYSYSRQLKIKKEFINWLAKKHGVKLPKFTFIKSPKISHYRNKMEYAIFPEGIGLREKGKWWKVLDGHTCFLASLAIEKVFFESIKVLKSSGIPAYNRKTHEGILRYLTIRSNQKGETLLSLTISDLNNKQFNPYGYQLKDVIRKITPLTTLPSVVGVSIKQSSSISDVSYGETVKVFKRNFLEETIKGVLYMFSTDTFFQTNMYTYDIYLNTLENFITSLKKDFNVLVDLYSGVGFFSIYLSKRFRFKRVIAVEEIAESIRFAQENAKINEINHIEIVRSRVEDYLSELTDIISSDSENTLVIVDPSRQGLEKKTLRFFKKFKPKYLIYVSCNIARFFDEYSRVLSYGYQIKDVVFLDNFPQTPHIEGFFLLTSV